MKNFLKRIVTFSIAQLARLIIHKYRPTIIMVTGSVGKTSTKDALRSAFSTKTYARASEKSYNTEFGVPLTVIGAENPWSNTLSWGKVILEGITLLLLPNHYPKVLVLEVGADRPGDLAKILKIATPDAVVVTKLPEIPVHVEAYPSPEAVREEEFVPAYGLAPGSPLIINAEDPYAIAYAKRLQARVMTFGFAERADARIEDAEILIEKGVPTGMRAAIRMDGVSHELRVLGVVGKPALLAAAAALLTARALDIAPAEALKGLASYTPPPGRARLFLGKNGSTLIDDSYNSSPVAAEEALSTLSHMPAKRRIAVLGDMLELGRYSLAEHERVGRLAAKVVDHLFAVGIRARTLLDGAKEGGMTEDRLTSCATAKDAAEAILPMLEKGDVVLAKGSQNNIRLERLIEGLLENPEDVKHLVRQDKEWKRR
ncbi:MAG: UDP-N-acetylmuramoyl-tripeptide--D-alanyl-D-alanine ligase [Candidatus Pacebacteria bacterium]|nr:UDP-N-acetylmuramoyl-tripeptide--D-alanyl-D-alanine ligase [Candidatus Paceibacterota bacterium]MBP9840591.1 UDP-N-acetylmuramoyl-tripeptide--D-alanyl-D-alanine ligase [Candidatus Paceibacterota bacterium]